jgi:hypothetical protein
MNLRIDDTSAIEEIHEPFSCPFSGFISHYLRILLGRWNEKDTRSLPGADP